LIAQLRFGWISDHCQGTSSHAGQLQNFLRLAQLF